MRPDSSLTASNDADSVVGFVADSADMTVTFHSTSPYQHRSTDMTSSYSEEPETGSLLGMGNIDPFDFSYYMDQVRVRIVLSVEASLTSVRMAV